MIAEEAVSTDSAEDNNRFYKSLLNKLFPKHKGEQQVNKTEKPYKRLLKRLSKHINFIAKERGVTWLNDRYWKTREDSQSEFGKIVSLEYVWWFEVWSILKAVLPGTYHVIWRLKITNQRLRDLNFRTTVIEKIEDDDDELTIKKYEHIPQNSMFLNVAKKGDWVEYYLPYKLVVPERSVVDGKLIYHNVRLDFINYDTNFFKSGVWIDYVRLREYDENRKYEKFEIPLNPHTLPWD